MDNWGTPYQPSWNQQPSHPHVYYPPRPYPTHPTQQYPARSYPTHPTQQYPPQPYPPRAQGGYWNQDANIHPWQPNTPRGSSYPADAYRSLKYPNLNPILAADTTRVRYDVRDKPSESIHNSIYATYRHLPAMATPSHYVRLISKAFPWSIDVKAPMGAQITCDIIWESIHAALREPLKDSEWGMAVIDGKLKETIERSARRRGWREGEALKRIDWLGDATLFRGLDKDDEFEKQRLLPGDNGCAETWIVCLA